MHFKDVLLVSGLINGISRDPKRVEIHGRLEAGAFIFLTFSVHFDNTAKGLYLTHRF
jgi:hypothetical protein